MQVFPRLSPIHQTHVTRYMFSRDCHRGTFFPRLEQDPCFSVLTRGFQHLARGVYFPARKTGCMYLFRVVTEAPFIWRKVVPGKRVTLPAESTLASVYMRKKLTLLPEPRADCLEIMKTCEKKKKTARSLQIKSVVFLKFTNVGFLYPRNSGSYGF